MGFLSRFDKKLAVGGIDELDPGRSDLGKALGILNPLMLPAQGMASGNLGPFGTPTEKGVNNPLAIKGITDVASDKGAEIAAASALGSWLGGGASGLFSSSESGAGAGAGAGDGAFVGDIPVDEAAGAGAGAGADSGAFVGDLPLDNTSDPQLLALADTGTTTDVSPGVLALDSGSPAAPAGDLGAADPGTGAYVGQTGSTDLNAPAQQVGSKGAADSSWMGAAKKYGVPLGLLGLSTALSSRKQQMPNQAQYSQLSAEAQATATQLLEQYRSGTLSPAMQAQLDQMTQNAKNQINNYYASIGQSGSTSHQQALQKADMDALAAKGNMLATSLQQGLQAIGVATGPLNAMATYKMQQDKQLQDAYANFARNAAVLYGSTQSGNA